MNDLDDDLIISKIEEILSRETIYFPSNIQITISEEDSKIIITLLDKYLTLKQNSIPKQKVKDKIDEINKKYEDSKDENGESPYYYPEYTIKVLEKLLEEK